MLRVENVSVRYPGNEEDSLQNVNLSFQQGEFVCVLGKSGAGKSTFIRCLNGLQQITNGEIYWNDEPLSNVKGENLRQIRTKIGMIFQQFHLVPRLTVLQNTLTGSFGRRNSWKSTLGIFSQQERERAESILKEVGLLEYKDKKVEQLSGGQKQRVGIARALLQEPDVLLGDEPVSSLDPGISNKIFTLLKDIHNRYGLLTIINVHDVELAKRFASRIITLTNGKVTFDGPPNDFDDDMFRKTYL